jgi:NAD(P)-dependent dehydrogenase (short-subunit alcohol dehydrogenase family)
LTLTGWNGIVKSDFPIGPDRAALTDRPSRATFVNMHADECSSAPVALVTGGANGIGAAVVRRLAASGARVVIADRDLPGEGSRSGRVEPHRVDVSDFGAVDALVAEIVERHGRLDYACNCAGVTGVRAEVADYPEAVFRRVLDVDAGGVFACMRAELGAMAPRGAGRVVNIASGAAALGVAGSSAYVAAKHAVAGLTRTAAIEYAARGIAVNAVSPGLVLTDAVDLDVESFVAAHPSGRAVTAEEIAEVVAWLLFYSPPQLTGALIPVDGGLTAQVAGAGAQ